MTFCRRALATALAFTVSGMATSVMAQTKWDLPAGYPATNFHFVTLTEFANNVDKASGGKRKITLHAGASLFKATEIKRSCSGRPDPDR